MANMQIVPASCKNVEAQYVEMMVPLYSYGCEKKVKKTLSHLKGIYSVNVDYHQQKVTVWGICNKYDVLAMMKSKRKEARFWNPQDNVIIQMEEEHSEPPRGDTNTNSISKPYYNFTLMKARSLTLRAWKRVFTRSFSF